MSQLDTLPELTQVWSPDRPAKFIGDVLAKLADGRYQTEAVRCFCGADFNDVVLKEQDRYFIPHRMVMCKECSLIRATPRMTADSYAEFYNTEYRPIYDGWQFGDQAEDDDHRFMVQGEQGVTFKSFLDYFDIKPKSLIDVGANMGGMLMPFKEEGCQVYGIEMFERGVQYGRENNIPMFRSIEEAVALGLKADVVIMQDVIEHLTDLREMVKVKDLLTPGGILYVSTPGVFLAKHLHLLWQNAHTYQFVAETLRYVMSQLGFEEMFLDEHIDSLWVYHGESVDIGKPIHWARYIVEHLEQKEYRALPPLRGVNKFPASTRWQYMDTNLARGHADLCDAPMISGGNAVIVGAGPTASQHIQEIKDLQASGSSVFVVERMYPWCSEHGITPDYVVALDSSDDVVEGFTKLQPGVTYLFASTVHPGAFDLVAKDTVYIFNALNPHLKVHNLWAKHGYDKVRVLNSGGSVTLACLALATTMGCRSLDFFGFDLKTVGSEDYAAGVAGHGVKRSYFEADVGGKRVITCIAFISFAQQFFHMVNQAKKSGLLTSVNVHGDSLINDMANLREMQ